MSSAIKPTMRQLHSTVPAAEAPGEASVLEIVLVVFAETTVLSFVLVPASVFTFRYETLYMTPGANIHCICGTPPVTKYAAIASTHTVLYT